MSYSITYAGVIVALLTWILQQSGLTIPQEQLHSFVETFGVLIGLIIATIGRYRKGDVTLAGFHK